MTYFFISFLSISIFVLVHLFASKTQYLNKMTHGRFLSASGGVSISYVFIDLLPKLSKNDTVVTASLSGIFPFIERHVYILALIGFLLFFTVDRVSSMSHKRGAFLLSLFSYALFNFFVGYAVADKNDPDIRPLALFTFAMSLHYFITDFSLDEKHASDYSSFGKWVLIFFLLLGWLMGSFYIISPAAVGLFGAFIAGGVIMNVTRHELPKGNPKSFWFFILTAVFYTLVLLGIG